MDRRIEANQLVGAALQRIAAVGRTDLVVVASLIIGEICDETRRDGGGQVRLWIGRPSLRGWKG